MSNYQNMIDKITEHIYNYLNLIVRKERIMKWEDIAKM